MRAAQLQALADRLWSLDSNDGTEASMVIRRFAQLQNLHQRSLCARARRLFGRVVNRFYGVRS